MKLSSILGLNARATTFAYRYNTRKGKNIADSKIKTAAVLGHAGVPYPKIFKKFRDPLEVLQFDWSSLPDKFAIKPSRGLGGEGIIVVKRKLKNTLVPNSGWITSQKERITAEDLKLHALDILEGAYSMGNVPDVAFIQEYVGRHPVFKRWAFRGTPDVRVIVFNKVPVMAMLRLPTRESGGRANLHQGAIGAGIDMATGITTRAIWHGEQIVYKPGTTRKLRGIKIPEWDKVLETAVKAQMASHLGYIGVDIVLHPEKGPMVLEMNAQPGLQIQLANMEGLRRRLDRVDELDVRDAEHGVKISKALFGGRFADRVLAESGIKTLHLWEDVKIVGMDGKRHIVRAKIDTGAWRSSIDHDLAKELGLLQKKNVLWIKKFKSSIGIQQRSIIGLKFYLAGKRIETMASVARRSNLRASLIIGRKDIAGFLISPLKLKKA